MATAKTLNSKGVFNAFDAVAASQTDSNLVTAVSGKKIRVTGLMINQGDTTASTVKFNSKPSGAGTAISPTFKYAANGGTSIWSGDGLFETNSGEGLTVTTGAGSTTGILVVYELVAS